MKRNSRIVSIPRFTAFIIICSVITTLLCMSIIDRIPEKEVQQEAQVTYNTVQVSEGESLWSIAEKNFPNESDLRNVINEIIDVNSLSSSTIKVGQTLKIPDVIV